MKERPIQLGEVADLAWVTAKRMRKGSMTLENGGKAEDIVMFIAKSLDEMLGINRFAEGTTDVKEIEDQEKGEREDRVQSAIPVSGSG